MNSTESASEELQPEGHTRGFRRMRRGFHPLRFFAKLALVLLCIVVFGTVTEYLWNWLIPSIFHLRTVRFTEAVGLVLLGKILFGGIHRGHGRPRWNKGRSGRRWKQHMRDKFERMTPEEREKFRSGMRGSRWNCRPTTPVSTEGDQ